VSTKLSKKRSNTIFKLKGILLLVVVSFWSLCHAAVAPVQVTTSPNIPIQIDLTSSITGVTNPVVTVSQPANGTATVSGLLVTYTPNPGVADVVDTFTYTVTNTSEQSTISVTIGAAITQGDSPQQAINETLAQLCLQTQQGSLADLCAAYSAATSSGIPADLREFLDALSPKDIAAQTDLGNDMARQQVESVSKRLAALRHGMREAASGKLALRLDDKSIALNVLRGQTGGGASADQGNIGGRFGWYLTGNLNFGTQNETVVQDGYKFNSGILTTGFDWRYKPWGVVGLAGGYGGTTMNVDNDGGNLDVKGYTGSLYASFFPSQTTYIDLVFSANSQKFTASRRIIFGQTDATADSSTNSSLDAISAGFGWEALHLGGLTGTLSAKYTNLESTIDGYSETGSSAFNLSIAERTAKQQTSDIGGNVTLASSHSWGVIVHQLDLSWIHQFSGDAETIQGSFVADTSNTVFEFKTDKPDTDYGRAAYGLQTVWPGGSTFFIQLQTTFAKLNYFDYGMAAGFRTEF